MAFLSLQQRLLVYFVVGLIAAMAWPYRALATTRYVGPLGADTTACWDYSNPCLTINYAIAQSAAGDSIFIFAGTYDEHGLEISHDLDINGEGQGVTIIDAQTLGNHFHITGQVNQVLFRDLTLQNGASNNGGCRVVLF